MDTSAEYGPPPSIEEVVRELSRKLVDQEGVVDKMMVQRVSDYHFMARVYLVGVEDYVAAQADFNLA